MTVSNDAFEVLKRGNEKNQINKLNRLKDLNKHLSLSVVEQDGAGAGAAAVGVITSSRVCASASHLSQMVLCFNILHIKAELIMYLSSQLSSFTTLYINCMKMLRTKVDVWGSGSPTLEIFVCF